MVGDDGNPKNIRPGHRAWAGSIEAGEAAAECVQDGRHYSGAGKITGAAVCSAGGYSQRPPSSRGIVVAALKN